MGCGTVAERYAEVLLARIAEEADGEAVFAEAGRLERAFAADPRIGKLLDDPAIPEEAKARALVSCDPERTAAMRSFVLFLAARRRVALLPAVVARVREEGERRRGTRRATVWSARELEPAELERLKRFARKRAGGECILETRVDPGVVGGFRMRLGDRMVDCSLRRQLDLLRGRLGA